MWRQAANATSRTSLTVQRLGLEIGLRIGLGLFAPDRVQVRRAMVLHVALASFICPSATTMQDALKTMSTTHGTTDSRHF